MHNPLIVESVKGRLESYGIGHESRSQLFTIHKRNKTYYLASLSSTHVNCI